MRRALFSSWSLLSSAPKNEEVFFAASFGGDVKLSVPGAILGPRQLPLVVVNSQRGTTLHTLHLHLAQAHRIIRDRCIIKVLDTELTSYT